VLTYSYLVSVYEVQFNAQTCHYISNKSYEKSCRIFQNMVSRCFSSFITHVGECKVVIANTFSNMP